LIWKASRDTTVQLQNINKRKKRDNMASHKNHSAILY